MSSYDIGDVSLEKELWVLGIMMMACGAMTGFAVGSGDAGPSAILGFMTGVFFMVEVTIGIIMANMEED